MKKKLIIIGASGHGKVCADIAEKMNQWQEIYFLDDNPNSKTCLNYNVIGTSDDVQKYKNDSDFFVAIGDNNTREKVLSKLLDQNYPIATLIHPHAIINSHVDIGVGTAAMAGVVINSDTVIGKGCIVNTSASVDHDNQIEDYVHLSPGVHLAGNVIIGKSTWVGIASSVLQSIKIIDNCTIGAASTVINDIKKRGLFVGTPAKSISK